MDALEKDGEVSIIFVLFDASFESIKRGPVVGFREGRRVTCPTISKPFNDAIGL
jgi:hypothetical protein